MPTSIENLSESTLGAGVVPANYAAHCAELAGQSVDFDDWEKGQKQRHLLNEASRVIADKLAAAGYRSRTTRDLSLVGLQSRQVLKLESFRDVSIIPNVARRKRRKLLKEVEYYLHRHPWTRMWTFTMGPRCTSEALPATLKELHRKVSRMNSEPFMREAGARIVFRATEFGELKDASGCTEPTFHPHAHCLVSLSGKLPAARWEARLKNVRSFWNHHWDESGRIRKSPREVVKYCAKPLELCRLSGEQLKYLQEEVLSKSRMVETMGALRAERRARKDKGLRIDCINGEWRESKQWNGAPTTRHLPFQEHVERLIEDGDLEAHHREYTLSSLLQDCRVEVPDAGLQAARVLARCLPSPVFSPVKEPIYLVENLDVDGVDAFFEREEVQWLNEFVRASKPAPIRVHTTSTTVGQMEGAKVQRKRRPPKERPKWSHLVPTS